MQFPLLGARVHTKVFLQLGALDLQRQRRHEGCKMRECWESTSSQYKAIARFCGSHKINVNSGLDPAYPTSGQLHCNTRRRLRPIFFWTKTCVAFQRRIISFQVFTDTERRFFRGDWWTIKIRYLQFTSFHWNRLSICHISFTESFPKASKMSHLETGEMGQRCKKHFSTWFDSMPNFWKGNVSESPEHHWIVGP